MAQVGRRPGPSETSEQILGAARKLFAASGYRGATIRAVATEAGVNQALVHHFFGSKQQLFAAAMSFPIDPADVIGQLIAACAQEGKAAALTRVFVRSWFAPDSQQQMLAALRTASSTPEGAAMARHFAGIMLPRVSELLGVPEVRLAAAIAQLLGLVLMASILQVEPLASLAEDELVTLLSPAIASYLTAAEEGRQ